MFGGLSESLQSEIRLKGISAVAFQLLLKYIYTGCINLCNLKVRLIRTLHHKHMMLNIFFSSIIQEELIKDLLGLAHQYAFPELEQAISDYFKLILNLNNVCLVYDVANLYQLCSLMESCHQYVDRYATEILHSDAFLQLSPVKLKHERLFSEGRLNNILCAGYSVRPFAARLVLCS